MATTSPPTPPPTPPPKEEKGGLTVAAAFFAFMAFVVGPNARHALDLFRYQLIHWYEDLSYTLDRWGSWKIIKIIVALVVLTLLTRFTMVHPTLRSGTDTVFWSTTFALIALAVYTWLAVSPVTSAGRAAAHYALEEARRRHVEVQDAVNAGTATGTALAAAKTAEETAREELRKFERRAGNPWLSFFDLGFIAWLCLVIQGFNYFLHSERAYHASQPTTEALMAHRHFVTNEFWFAVLGYAGPLWFLLLYGIPKWIVGPVAKLASKGERAFIRLLQAGEAASMDGPVTKDIEERDLRLRKEYGETYRTTMDVLRNELEHPFFGIMFGSALQVLVARRTMHFAVTIDSALAGVFLLILETALVNRLTDHVPLVHEKPKWMKALSVLPMVPPIYALIVGGDANGVVSPLYYWGLITGAFRSAGHTVAHVGHEAAGPTGHYVHRLGHMTIAGNLVFALILGGAAALLFLYWRPVSTNLKKIEHPLVRFFALPVIGFFTLLFTYSVCATVFRAPNYISQADASPSPEQQQADNARRTQSPELDRVCRLNVHGFTRCTDECFRYHHWLPEQNIDYMRQTGRCYVQ